MFTSASRRGKYLSKANPRHFCFLLLHYTARPSDLDPFVSGALPHVFVVTANTAFGFSKYLARESC